MPDSTPIIAGVRLTKWSLHIYIYYCVAVYVNWLQSGGTYIGHLQVSRVWGW